MRVFAAHSKKKEGAVVLDHCLSDESSAYPAKLFDY